MPNAGSTCFNQMVPTACLERPSAQPSPSTLTLSLVAYIVTLLAQVERTSCSFCHTGHALVELEALLSTLVAHVQGPARLADCTRDEAQLLHLFFHFPPHSTVVLRQSCVSPRLHTYCARSWGVLLLLTRANPPFRNFDHPKRITSSPNPLPRRPVVDGLTNCVPILVHERPTFIVTL